MRLASELRRGRERVAMQTEAAPAPHLPLSELGAPGAVTRAPRRSVGRHGHGSVTSAERSRSCGERCSGAPRSRARRGYGYRFVPMVGARPREESLEAPSGARPRANDDAPPPLGTNRGSRAATRLRRSPGRARVLRTRPGRGASRGSGPALVAAPAGTGKTRLTREFAGRARARGFRALVGQAWRAAELRLLALRPHPPSSSPPAGESMDSSAPAEGAITRFRLFADVVGLLRRRAEQEPCCSCSRTFIGQRSRRSCS